jgi:hypothetical protein
MRSTSHKLLHYPTQNIIRKTLSPLSQGCSEDLLGRHGIFSALQTPAFEQVDSEKKLSKSIFKMGEIVVQGPNIFFKESWVEGTQPNFFRSFFLQRNQRFKLAFSNVFLA